MKATVKIQRPQGGWRVAVINHRHRVTFGRDEWLESLTYLEGGPFKLITDDGQLLWCGSQGAPVFIRFDPWAMPSGFRMRRLA